MNKPVCEERGRQSRQTPESQLQDCKLKECDLPLTDVAVLESHTGKNDLSIFLFPASVDKWNLIPGLKQRWKLSSEGQSITVLTSRNYWGGGLT